MMKRLVSMLFAILNDQQREKLVILITYEAFNRVFGEKTKENVMQVLLRIDRSLKVEYAELDKSRRKVHLMKLFPIDFTEEAKDTERRTIEIRQKNIDYDHSALDFARGLAYLHGFGKTAEITRRQTRI